MAELTSKQRAQLRGLANSIDTILIVGKDGIGENMLKQANDALEARELIKGRVLENALMTPREVAEQLAPLTRSEVVQVIGTKFVLYRTSHTIPREKRIELVTAGQKKTVKAETASKSPAKTVKKIKAKPVAKSGKTTGKPAYGRPVAGKTARKSGKK